jgi:hypothetical protein
MLDMESDWVSKFRDDLPKTEAGILEKDFMRIMSEGSNK